MTDLVTQRDVGYLDIYVISLSVTKLCYVCTSVSIPTCRKALRHMPPLSLTPSSTEFPKFFSANILEEVDGFLLRIAE